MREIAAKFPCHDSFDGISLAICDNFSTASIEYIADSQQIDLCAPGSYCILSHRSKTQRVGKFRFMPSHETVISSS